MIRTLHERARALNKKIVLPEGEDPRTIRAAHRLVEEGLARQVLLRHPDRVHAVADEEGIALPHTVPIINPDTSEKRSE